MIRLPLNQATCDTLLSFLDGSPDQIAFLATLVQTHGANPQDYYVTNPAPDTAWETVQTLPAFAQQDWSRMVHPHVTAQLLVNLCEKVGQPLPDNLHVAVDGAWQPLAFVQPTYTVAAAQTAAPAPAPAPAPAADPYPPAQPVASVPPPPASLTLQPDAESIVDAEFVTREVMGAPVTMTTEAAAQIDAARDTPRSTVEQAQALQAGTAAPTATVDQTAVAMPRQDAPAAAPAPTLAGAGEFGLPQPFMTASKGTSVFDKDPGGEPPKGASPRQVRDIMAMLPAFFAAPAGDVVGKGTGSVQRHRLYTSAALMLHTALSSVPDKNCSVGYLLWHLEHLRYNAVQTPGGETMRAYEEWMFREGE